jgi:hypothetical protein
VCTSSKNRVRRIVAGALGGITLALTLSAPTGVLAQAGSPPANVMVAAPKRLGPWSVSGWSQGYCAGERALAVTGGTPLQFGVVRSRVGYRLAVISASWDFKPATVFPIELNAQPVFRSDADALVGGPKLMVIDLGSDVEFMRKLAGAPVIEIKTPQGTFKLPLEGFRDMVTELDSCFDALRRQMANPFAPRETETKKVSSAQ